MASRAFACPKCKTKLTAPEGAERFRCPGCKAVLTAPSEKSAPAQDAAPPPQGPPPLAPPRQSPPAPPALPPQTSAPAQAPPPADEELPAGTRLGAYQITRRIGRGAMATVYEAVQDGLNRRVALKVLPSSAAANAAFLDAFRLEARAAAKLSHADIVQIFDIVEDQGRHFFSMEHVAGQSLADRISREGPLSPVAALEMLARLAAALDHASENMLIHRDLKPANILFSERGDVKLADLGLARSLEQTPAGIVGGIGDGQLYLAPEFARNPHLADCRSDIYALGCVLYHALTGQAPFPGPSPAELARQHATSPMPSARALVPQVPDAVDALIQKMCAKDPADRFQTHAELAEQVELLLEATAVRSPAKARRRRSASGPRVALIAGIALAAAAVLAAGVFLVLPRLRGKPPRAAKTPAAVPATSTGPPTTALSVVHPPSPPKPTPAPPRPATTAPPVVPPEKPGPDEPGPKPGPDEPKEPPKPPPEPVDQPPGWKARLAEATKQAESDVRARRFGKAIAALEALTKGDAPPELRAAVADAAKELRARAARACRDAWKAAAGLAAQGEYDKARRALSDVVDNFGTPAETQIARSALTAINQHEHLHAGARQAEADAAEAAKLAQQRAALRKKFAAALGPIDAQIGQWQLAQASAALAALTFDDRTLAAQIAQRKSAVDALIKLRARMIQHIKTAKPPIKKRALRLTGLNGDIIDADEAELTCSIKFGARPSIQKLPWPKLRDVSAELLAQRVAEADSGPDALATGLLLRLLGSEERAKTHFQRAEALGTPVDAFLTDGPPRDPAAREAGAARAFADALAAHVAGKHDQARAAMAAYEKQFAKTAHYAAHEQTVQLAKAFKPFTPPKATPVPKPGPDEPKPKPPPRPVVKPEALALYNRAAKAFAGKDYDACKTHLAALKAKFGQSPLLSDAKRRPSVAAMLEAIAARGPRVLVSARAAKGAFRSLKAAFSAIDKPNGTIAIEPGTYHGGALFMKQPANGLTIRGIGDKAPTLDGGRARATILNFPADAAKVLVERLEFAHSDTAIRLGEGCSATLRRCIAIQAVERGLDKAPDARVTIESSILAIAGLTGATARFSAFLCDETPIDNGTLTGCILAGPNISLTAMRLTDCLVIGPVTLLDGNVLSHVTFVGPVTIAEDVSRNVISNSILDLVRMRRVKIDKKDRPPVAATFKNCIFARKPSVQKELVKLDDAKSAKPVFASPRSGDYRLAKGSPLRERIPVKGSKTKRHYGCNFPPAMLELLKVARRYPALLKPTRKR